MPGEIEYNYKTLDEYNKSFIDSLAKVEIWMNYKQKTNPESGYKEIYNQIDKVIKNRKKLIFIGNGASAAIASHMSADFSKRGGIRSITFTDPSLLTCLSNDLGYENVYKEAIKIYTDPDDMLFAISSSGESKNIINAIEESKNLGCKVITFTGFAPNNAMKLMGDVNVYIPAYHYGFVETAHHLIIHGILDIISKEKES